MHQQTQTTPRSPATSVSTACPADLRQRLDRLEAAIRRERNLALTAVYSRRTRLIASIHEANDNRRTPGIPREEELRLLSESYDAEQEGVALVRAAYPDLANARGVQLQAETVAQEAVRAAWLRYTEEMEARVQGN